MFFDMLQDSSVSFDDNSTMVIIFIITIYSSQQTNLKYTLYTLKTFTVKTLHT